MAANHGLKLQEAFLGRNTPMYWCSLLLDQTALWNPAWGLGRRGKHRKPKPTFFHPAHQLSSLVTAGSLCILALLYQTPSAETHKVFSKVLSLERSQPGWDSTEVLTQWSCTYFHWLCLEGISVRLTLCLASTSVRDLCRWEDTQEVDTADTQWTYGSIPCFVYLIMVHSSWTYGANW